MRRTLFVLLLIGGLCIAPASVAAAASAHGVREHRCTSPNYKTSKLHGGKAYGKEEVLQDVWDALKIKQTLYACAGDSWYVKAVVGDKGGAVQSYPNVETNFKDPKVSSLRHLDSKFRVSDPPTGSGLDYEAAYDIWLGSAHTWYARTHTEMMIWPYSHRQVPAGKLRGTVRLDGRTWKVWFAGKIGSANGDIVTYRAEKNYTRGTTDLFSFFRNAAKRGYLEAGTSTRLWQVDFGYELCGTPHSGSEFQVTAFSVKARS